MNRKEFLSVRSIFPDDTINELRRARAADPPFDEEIHVYKKLVEENARMDKSYKKLMLCLIYMDQNVEPEKELQDEDDEACDLEPRRSQLMNEVDEVENVRGSLDMVLDSHEVCDPKLGKKVNTGKQRVGHSNQMLDVESCSTQSRTKLVNEVEMEIENHSPDMGFVSHKECDPKLGKKVSGTGKRKEGHSNQMPDVENCSTQSPTKLPNEVEVEIEEGSLDMALVSHKECDPKLGKKANGTGKWKVGQMLDLGNCSTHGCTELTNEVEVEVEKGSPHMVVLDSHKESDPKLGKKGNRTGKWKVGHSNQMLDVENRLTRSRTKLVNEVEMEIEKGSPDMVLDSQKECDPKLGKKVNRTRKQKVGHNQMVGVENSSTRSRTRLANEVEVEIEKGSPDMVLVSRRRKQSRVAKPKVGPSNQMADVENQHEHDWEYNLVKKTNRLTKRKSTNKADRVGNTYALPNDTVLDPGYHHLHQNVILEKDPCDKDFEIQPGKQNIRATNQKKRKVDESSNSLKKTKCLSKRKVTFEVDKVYNVEDGLNAMELDSHKEGPSEIRRKLNRATKQKVGPSNQMADVEKNQKHDQPSCSLKKTKAPAKRKARLEVDKVYSMEGATNQQNVGPSNQMPSVENKRKGDQQRNSLRKKKDEVKVENMKDSPIDLVSYPEHFVLYDKLASYPEFIDLEEDNDSYMHKGNTVANYETNSGADVAKKEQKDDSDSDVEILDAEAIMEGEILSNFVPSKRIHNSMDDSTASEDEFRKQVLDVLKKPFNKEEYKRHQEAAKCYLDHHPDLKRILKKYRWKQGKRLTIFRGFFFWLQNLTQEGSFKPWTDCECLAVEPERL